MYLRNCGFRKQSSVCEGVLSACVLLPSKKCFRQASQADKVYVQDRLRESSDLVWRLLQVRHADHASSHEFAEAV
jgi:hypothetical protein